VADTPPKEPEFTRFKDLTRKLVSVPKAEVDARKAAKIKRARKPKPAPES
jgi:hypothetical protein